MAVSSSSTLLSVETLRTDVAVFHDGTVADIAKRTAWALDLHRALNQGDDAASVNFLTDEGPERVRAAYPGPPEPEHPA